MSPKVNGAVGPAKIRHDAAEGQDHRSTPTLEGIVRALVHDELRRLGVSSLDYTSEHLPPGIATRKSFAKICASGIVQGAEQDGPRGSWRCSREAWNAARRRKPKLAPPKLRLVVQDLTDEDVVAGALAGLRRGR